MKDVDSSILPHLMSEKGKRRGGGWRYHWHCNGWSGASLVRQCRAVFCMNSRDRPAIRIIFGRLRDNRRWREN